VKTRNKGYISSFRPPQRATIPLWLALVLKKQRRCNIVPPTWLSSDNIEFILAWETEHPESFSPALPWRWLETAEILLAAAADDISDAGMGGERDLRVLLRGLREVRQTKAREGLKQLESTYLQMNGLGLLEITELRGFAAAVTDGLRRLEATREESRRQEEEEGADDEENGEGSTILGGSTERASTARGTGSAVRGSSAVLGGSSVTYDDEL